MKSDTQKVYNYFKPVLDLHKGKISIVGFLFTLSNILGNVIAPIFYKNIINEASLQSSSQIFVIAPLLYILLGIVGIQIVMIISTRIGSHVLNRFQNKAISDIHLISFKKVTNQTFDFFSSSFIGTLTGKISRLSRNFKDLFDTLFFGFFLLFINIFFSITILFRENIQLGLLFSIFMMSFFFLSFFLSKKQGALDKKRSEKASKRMGVISDILTNIFNVKIFSNRNQEYEYYESSVSELADARMTTWTYQNKVRIIKNIFFFFFEIGALFLALRLFTQGQISIGTLVLVQSYIITIILSSWYLDKSLVGFVEAYSDAVDAIDVVTTPIAVQDILNPESVSITSGEINLNNISFTYPEGDHVFEKFNFKINAGQSVGIVGKSGSGKTTLTKLLLRFYDIDSGEITIDDQDIARIKQDDLRSHIAYIPQDTILFHRTIFENIAYGNLDASHAEVLAAAKSAHVDEFVQNLELGYETKVGERGIKLSGGQRQRIGIARAMLKKSAPILILDEATSSLDSMSEKYIQDSFEKLSQNRTTIVIAHRLSTIQKMDRIIVMDKGQIIEDGSHSELLQKNGHYAELWNSQINGFIQD